MRLIRCKYQDPISTGVLIDDEKVLFLKHAAALGKDAAITGEIAGYAASMTALLAAMPQSQKTLSRLLEEIRQRLRDDPRPLKEQGAVVALSAVRVLAPLPNPSKIIAVGLNYMDHCREQNVEPPRSPVIFTKFPSAIIAPRDTIRWDSKLTQKVDYEAELAVVIGKRASRVSEKDAYDYVAGYTAINDVSARDLQFGDGQWVRGKSLDTFCPMGPLLVTRDEIPDPHRLAIQCFVNGEALQDSSTSEMIFKIPYLIAFITRAITLEPGDIISTGTPHGVGVFRQPPRFLKHGETVQVKIEKIGVLENPTGTVQK